MKGFMVVRDRLGFLWIWLPIGVFVRYVLVNNCTFCLDFCENYVVQKVTLLQLIKKANSSHLWFCTPLILSLFKICFVYYACHHGKALAQSNGGGWESSIYRNFQSWFCHLKALFWVQELKETLMTSYMFLCLLGFHFGWWLKLDILQEDWQKERRDFLQSLSRISSSPWTKIVDSSTGRTHPGQLASLAYSPHASSGPSGMEIVPLANKPIVEKKAPACAEVVKNLNRAREHGSQFKVRPVCLLLFSVKTCFHMLLKDIYFLSSYRLGKTRESKDLIATLFL